MFKSFTYSQHVCKNTKNESANYDLFLETEVILPMDPTSLDLNPNDSSFTPNHSVFSDFTRYTLKKDLLKLLDG